MIGLLVLIMLLSSCNGNVSVDSEKSDQTSESKETEETEETKELAAPMVLVTADGKANCTVTKPKNASKECEDAVSNFVREIEKKTGVRLPVVDEVSEIVTEYEIAINAKTGRSPLVEQYEATAYTDYVIGLWDWHIMLTTHSDRSIKAGLKKISSSLEQIDEGFCIREDIGTSASAILGDKKASVPLYESANGKEFPLYSVSKGYEICVQNTTEDEFKAYTKKLEACGYTKYSENAISAGKSVAGKNLSYVYTAEDMQVFMNWSFSKKIARIIFTEPTELPALTKPALASGDTAKTSIAQIGIGGNGMSYAIQLKDYSFIVIDGGNSADAEPFLALLQKYSDSTKVTVDYWIITHPHGDHYFCLRELCKREDILEKLEVKNLMYHLPTWLDKETPVRCATSRDELENIACVLGANTVYPKANEKIVVGGAEIELLYVFDGKEKVDNGNGLSLIFTVTDGKRVMITGDAFKPSLRRMAEEYGDKLKSDVLQMPHHALCDTGNLEFFKFVDAREVILPTCIAGYRAMNENAEYRAHNVANKYAEDNAHIVYKSFEGNFEILL